MSLARWIAALPLVALGCTAATGSPGPGAPIDDADPLTLTWYSPAAFAGPNAGESTSSVGQPLELGVATQNPEVTVLHFVLDGQEVGACDATQPALGCHTGDLWRWTVTLTSPGAHAAEAWFETPSGASARVRLAIEAQAQSTPSPVPSPSAPSEPDPVAEDQLDLDSTGGFTDPAQQAMNEAAADREEAANASPDDLPPDAQSGTETDTTPLDYPFASSPMRGYLDPSRATHAAFGGLAWSTAGQRVVLAGLTLDGDAFGAGACYAEIGDAVRRYADLNYVSRASLVAAAMAATDCDTDSATNVMGLPSAVCVAVTAQAGAPLDAPTCAEQMHASYDFAVQIAARWLGSDGLRRLHQNDPPLLGAVYATGALAPSRATRWHLLAPPDYSGDHDFVTTFVASYNAFRTAERTGEVDHDPAPTGP